MCLIAFAWKVHPKYPFVLVANRDEFYQRPTAPAGYWKDHPDILGGKDLQAGGSWMLLRKSGRFAAVTNYRDLANIKDDAKSRGNIPTDYVLSKESPSGFLIELDQEANQYNGFNAIVSDMDTMAHYSNYEGKVNVLTPGIYGLSNALLDTPWPKVERLKEKFRSLMDTNFRPEELLELVNDTALAKQEELPDTGVPKDMEKALSAMCIRMENYGTCCSTAIVIDQDHQATFIEKSYPVGDRKEQVKKFELKIG